MWAPGPEGERLCLQGAAFPHSPFPDGTSASPGGLCASQSSAVGGTVLGKRKQWARLEGLTGAEAGRDLPVPLYWALGLWGWSWSPAEEAGVRGGGPAKARTSVWTWDRAERSAQPSFLGAEPGQVPIVGTVGEPTQHPPEVFGVPCSVPGGGH